MNFPVACCEGSSFTMNSCNFSLAIHYNLKLIHINLVFFRLAIIILHKENEFIYG